MKKVLVIVMVSVLVVHVVPARASMMCAHDWLEVWRAHAGRLPGLLHTEEVNNPQPNVWAVSSTLGEAGRQSVLGIFSCSNLSSGNSPGANSGSICWCRIISPIIGNWRHTNLVPCNPLHPGGAGCASGCAHVFGGNQIYRQAMIP